MKETNKAGYTATPVACGWAGAIFGVTSSFGPDQWGQRPLKPQKSEVWWTNRQTDRQTNRQTNRPAKWGEESRSMRLKMRPIWRLRLFLYRSSLPPKMTVIFRFIWMMVNMMKATLSKFLFRQTFHHQWVIFENSYCIFTLIVTFPWKC